MSFSSTNNAGKLFVTGLTAQTWHTLDTPFTLTAIIYIYFSI